MRGLIDRLSLLQKIVGFFGSYKVVLTFIDDSMSKKMKMEIFF